MTNNNESTDYLLLHMCSKGVDNNYSSLYWVIFFFTFAFGNSVRKIMYSNNTYSYAFPYRNFVCFRNTHVQSLILLM